jgi:nucleotide-binding universal stress UspA family protein
MLGKILCPVDFSGGSNAALELATRLAIANGSELVLAHAWQYPGIASTEPMMQGRVINLAIEDEKRGLETALEHARKLGAKRVTSTFLEGSPWHQLVDLAKSGGFDLIVMGTAGRTGLKRMLIGSVAEQVVRHSPVSVLVVRDNPDGPRFDHVLCPVDFSPDSPRIIERAEAFVEPGGTGLDLMHVIELPLAAGGDPMLTELVTDVDARATTQLEGYVTDVTGRRTFPIRSEVLTGKPTEMILAKLDEDRTFDLVVVGTHGRTGLKRMVMGSVAEQLVRHAPCSVLVIRARS